MTKNKESTRYYSHQQEKKLAKDLGGKCSANSGAALWSGAGDVFLNNCAIECKTKMQDCTSFGIKKEWLDKLKEEACFDHKEYYALAFNFGPGQSNYMVIPQWMFEEYLDSKK